MFRVCVFSVLVSSVLSNTLYFHRGPDKVTSDRDQPANDPDVSDGVMCPDGRSECSIGQTCCKLQSGAYGCCPYPKAVCCKDHVHCCPERLTCDLRHMKCAHGRTEVPLAVHLPSKTLDDRRLAESQVRLTQKEEELAEKQNIAVAYNIKLTEDEILLTENKEKLLLDENVLIQNAITLTEDKMKLIEDEDIVIQNENLLTENSIDATEEKIHVVEDKLRANAGRTEKELPVPAVNGVKCPGGQSQCPDGSTCCKLASGQYGCCPLPKAVCCSDHTHCCPSGTTCDVKEGKCNKGGVSIPWVEKQLALPKVTLESVVCPDGQSQCPDGSTYCKLASGQYGCCPLPKAVCCFDHTHCCPSGTTCDVKEGKCNNGGVSIPWVEKQPALPKVTLESVVCPDGQSQCPDGSTCCKLASGQYGCCPLPNAVCCPDHTHCCPSGATCGKGHCLKGDVSLDWVKKQPALPKVPAENVECPGGQSQCPDGSTCCKLASGQYGCCPLPKAVCCSDHTHCCPSGTTCDVKEGKCNKGGVSIPWVKKQLALSKMSGKNIKCPDGQSQCPDGSTCCKLASGQYGCCPLREAVCCSDHTHCCPAGTTCDITQGKCQRGYSAMPLHENQLSRPVSEVTETQTAVICPDGQSQCPDGSTCCKLASGQYGCCPLPKAVCCADHTHCCPTATTCDVKAGKCTRGHAHLPWVEKIPARPVVNHGDKKILCPDGHYQCPDGSTCCKLASGQYGCCPFPKAQCCSDHRHCCPEGSTCDVSKGTCSKGEVTVPWAEKHPAAPRR